jgi:hypothetical protein
MSKKIWVMAITLALCLGAASATFSGPACPWKISSVQVGKWMNGKNKANIWINGSFPIPSGVSERPTWYVNGQSVGHSKIFFKQRLLEGKSYLLKPGKNTIKVQFKKPPYNGASNTKVISNFNWKDVRPGGYKEYR